jgi:UDP-sulfoquinovose synthase
MTIIPRTSSLRRILLSGVDGYLGWPAAQYLAARGHIVGGIDNYFRRRWVREMGSLSAIPVAPIEQRLEAFRRRFGRKLEFWEGDLQNYGFTENVVREFQPEAIVHLAQCPSAAFSMMDAEHAVFVQTNNLVTTFNLFTAMRQQRPECHFVKVGSMNEYGTPGVPIPEGSFDVVYRGRQDRMPFPRQADNWYGWSEIFSSSNLMFACQNWNLRASNLMPGIVYGTRGEEGESDERLRTRLDFDQAFGTVANRFCCEAIAGHALTPFGDGRQRRPFLSLRDAVKAISLAVDSPAQPGEYRALNHFSDTFGIAEVALKVSDVAAEFGIKAELALWESPRGEVNGHDYTAQADKLLELGYWPDRDFESELRLMFEDLLPHRERIRSRQDVFLPDIHWSGLREKICPLPARAAAAAAG